MLPDGLSRMGDGAKASWQRPAASKVLIVIDIPGLAQLSLLPGREPQRFVISPNLEERPMHAKTVLKVVAPMAAAFALAFAAPTIAAPADSSVKQSQGKPDCKKHPEDARCKGK